MTSECYPALFRCADEGSNRKQKYYLSLLKAEYGLLLFAAVLSMNTFEGPTFYTVYAFVFIVAAGVLLTRALQKPDQDWYKCRALAESVKTLTWRYVMRAAPFKDNVSIAIPRSEFRNHLNQLFSENRAIAEKIAPDWSAEDQITGEMDRIRGLPLEERLAYYQECRVKEQRNWYARKASANKKAFAQWVTVSVVAYGVATGLVIARVRFPQWHFWPIEPIIVLATSIIGWMQVKKFNELSAAYSVTAHEIGMIAPKLTEASEEPEFSEAVNEAELAFSREHTLWIARQTS